MEVLDHRADTKMQFSTVGIDDLKLPRSVRSNLYRVAPDATPPRLGVVDGWCANGGAKSGAQLGIHGTIDREFIKGFRVRLEPYIAAGRHGQIPRQASLSSNVRCRDPEIPCRSRGEAVTGKGIVSIVMCGLALCEKCFTGNGPAWPR
jgi:hypothetical protein